MSEILHIRSVLLKVVCVRCVCFFFFFFFFYYLNRVLAQFNFDRTFTNLDIHLVALVQNMF